MAFPKLLQRLFQNSGAGDKLNTSILPVIPEANLPSTVAYKSNIPTKVSQLTNDSGYTTGENVLGSEQGTLELKTRSDQSHGGFIDFHYKGSSADYTSRIIEDGSGKLSVTAGNGFYVNGVKFGSGSSSASAYITSTWHSGTSWYRKWSDGFIEQGGSASCVNGSTAITFPTAFTSVPKIMFKAVRNCVADGDSSGSWIRYYSTTGFTPTINWNGGTYTTVWIAYGY